MKILDSTTIKNRIKQLEAERDAALAHVAKLREALVMARDSIDVRFSDDEYNAVVDGIDAVLAETKGE